MIAITAGFGILYTIIGGSLYASVETRLPEWDYGEKRLINDKTIEYKYSFRMNENELNAAVEKYKLILTNEKTAYGNFAKNYKRMLKYQGLYLLIFFTIMILSVYSTLLFPLVHYFI